MLFNSLSFVGFFIIVVGLYFILPHRYRWGLLLFSSCYFYAAFIPWYLLILGFLIGADFWLAQRIEQSVGSARRGWLVVSIVSNVGALFIFKYFNFFSENMAALAGLWHGRVAAAVLRLALPIGLSFHTFQSLSYVIEVYRGRWSAEKHLGIYALYVMFFPQLVAGPIERPAHMLPQFRMEHRFDMGRLRSGIERMIIGFFKKIVIADQLAVFVNVVYSAPTQYPGVSLAIATVFFAWQIYCDFSGYCDIAIGAAQVLGFNLTENFQSPYLSASVAEFWRRWHISLSSWFRDYVYVPLGGSRATWLKTVRNLLITFLLSGLWHGANWTFIVWGGLNGLYLVAGRWWRHFWPRVEPLSRGRRLWGMVATFLLLSVTWIFFRATSLSEAVYIIPHLVSGWGNIIQKLFDPQFVTEYIWLGQTDTQFWVALSGIFGLLGFEILASRGEATRKLFVRLPWARYVGYTTLVLLTLALWQGKGADFIYFQF